MSAARNVAMGSVAGATGTGTIGFGISCWATTDADATGTLDPRSNTTALFEAYNKHEPPRAFRVGMTARF